MRTRAAMTRRNRGVTLLEALVFSALWAVLAVVTMRALAEGRELRGDARDRTRMALIAQGELERVRALPAADLREGVTERADPGWPRDVRSAVELLRRPDGTWQVDVRMTRESDTGKAPVRLTTVRTGAGQ
jgi:type II secretory pathway component PulJ